MPGRSGAWQPEANTLSGTEWWSGGKQGAVTACGVVEWCGKRGTEHFLAPSLRASLSTCGGGRMVVAEGWRLDGGGRAEIGARIS